MTSKNLALKYYHKITTFVYNDDVVSRACLGSIEALKNSVVQIANMPDNNFHRFYHILNAGKPFGNSFNSQVERMLNVKDFDFSKIDKGKRTFGVFLTYFRYKYRNEIGATRKDFSYVQSARNKRIANGSKP